jgi:hypothetical protein
MKKGGDDRPLFRYAGRHSYFFFAPFLLAAFFFVFFLAAFLFAIVVYPPLHPEISTCTKN